MVVCCITGKEGKREENKEAAGGGWVGGGMEMDDFLNGNKVERTEPHKLQNNAQPVIIAKKKPTSCSRGEITRVGGKRIVEKGKKRQVKREGGCEERKKKYDKRIRSDRGELSNLNKEGGNELVAGG